MGNIRAPYYFHARFDYYTDLVAAPVPFFLGGGKGQEQVLGEDRKNVCLA